MINKVKPPIALKLVQSSKQAKNDLSGQSAESYSQNSEPEKAFEGPKNGVPADPKEVEAADQPVESGSLEDQVGLTNVVKEWLEERKGNNSISRQTLSLKYQGESAPAKGMLLNKKIS